MQFSLTVIWRWTVGCCENWLLNRLNKFSTLLTCKLKCAKKKIMKWPLNAEVEKSNQEDKTSRTSER